MYHVFRLERGHDLFIELEAFLIKNNIEAGVILSGVGCVYELNIRLADGITPLNLKDNFEIVSITGTLSQKDSHIHVSFSGKDGKTIGGHLLKGCIINTTAEICILELENKVFKREFDKNTGYDELVVYDK